MKKLKTLWSTVSAEVLLVAGAFFIVAATARISTTATIYLIGFMFVAFGLLMAKRRG